LTLAFLLAVPAIGSAQAAVYDTLSIVAPTQNETVHDNRGDVAVVVSVSPKLRAGDRVAVLLDGERVASAAGDTIALSGVDRGTHTLRAQIVSPNGTVLSASDPVAFYMWQASRLFPNRRH